MGRIAEIISGMGILIGMYLILSHANSSVAIISQLGSSGSKVISTLQGR